MITSNETMLRFCCVSIKNETEIVPLSIGNPLADVVPLYNAIVCELERRRRAAGIPMERMSELAGTADRSYAKLLSPESASGRIGNWRTLQMVVDVLFCEGFELRIVPSSEPRIDSPGTRRRIIEEASSWDRKTPRELSIENGRAGGKARLVKMTAEQRREVSMKAARVRWARRRAQLETV
jgi:hypothetical protein